MHRIEYGDENKKKQAKIAWFCWFINVPSYYGRNRDGDSGDINAFHVNEKSKNKHFNSRRREYEAYKNYHVW